MQQAAAVLAKPGFQQAAANLGWLLAERAVRFLLVVVVTFVVARHLGPERLGTLSYCVAVATLIAGFVGLGFDAIIRRDILQAPERAVEILASAAVARFTAAVVGYAGLIAAAALGVARTPEEHRLLAIVGLLLFQPGLGVADAWLQARLQARASVLAGTAALAVGAAARIVAVLTDAPLAVFAGIAAGEAVLTGLGWHLQARRHGLSFRWAAARLAEIRRLIAQSWPLIFAGMAIAVYMETDEIMLRQMAGPLAVGTYAAATRLTEVWYFIPTALASSLLPALLRARAAGAGPYRERLQRYYDLNAAAAYGIAVPVALAAPWLIRIAYGPSFAAAAPIVAIHVWSSVFVFLGVARGQWLVNEQRQRFYLISTSVGAVVNVGLNLLLIPRWGGTGAALATVVAQALAGWGSSFATRSTREAGVLQTRALLLPALGWRYLRRTG